MKKLIFIITFSPKYAEYENQPDPEYCWINQDGLRIGISGLDFGDLICKTLVDYYSEYDCEVWQPDLRADKIYSAQFQDRFVHRNYPAIIRKIVKRCKFVDEIYSETIIKQIGEYDDKDTVFMLPAKEYSLWLTEILATIKMSKILYFYFLNNEMLLTNPIHTVNPLKAVNRLLLNREKLLGMREVRDLLISNNNPEAQNKLQQKYPLLRMFFFKNGMDLDFWRPVMSKSEARKLLAIPSDSFVIVLSQRLIPDYQIDRFIETVSRINPIRNFVCYITGLGFREYEEFLKNLVAHNGQQDRIHFVGFVNDEILRNYFIAADLFATVPIISAGSFGAKKCMAIGTPILHVTSGSTYEFLKEHNAGEFVSPTDYDSWVPKLQEIIDGKPVRTIPREVIEMNFSWKSTAYEVHYAIQNSQ